MLPAGTRQRGAEKGGNQAGFTRFRRLAIESAFHTFYEVRP
jgi:hypothetical protein